MTQRPGRPEAAAVVWTWRDAAPPRRPDPRPVRLRGLLRAAAGLAVAGVLAWLGHEHVALVVSSAATLLVLAALLSPLGLYAAIERLFGALGSGVQRTLTWIVLPLIFYLFFVPFGLLFRRGRRDSMRRFYDAGAPSYWSPRGAPAATGAERYRP
jgi:hypothetical protein